MSDRNEVKEVHVQLALPPFQLSKNDPENKVEQNWKTTGANLTGAISSRGSVFHLNRKSPPQ